ncbi:T-cell-specific surface glycoprotein CD28 [Megalops cyprinoides]|uniref:T-cell-specific surface glycoprotein CD28 n=1 Tax=Megalops cyprinoides TaxID=118141 RepID=UPI00186440C2|nr:T-cell-specific surface glycoprotein CD28 [Megalops cyprinoides]
MSVSWITVTHLLHLGLLAAHGGLSPCSKERHLRVEMVTVNGSATVRCPNVTGDELRFTLCRGQKKVSFSSLRKDERLNHTEVGAVEFQVSGQNHTGHFVLSRLVINSTGLYTCEVEVVYPPPYVKHEELTFVLVREPPCQPEKRTGCPPVGNLVAMWEWVLACGVLTLYSAVITGVAVVIWRKLERDKSLQQDYMNMKPRAQKPRQKVLHPERIGW